MIRKISNLSIKKIFALRILILILIVVSYVVWFGFYVANIHDLKISILILTIVVYSMLLVLLPQIMLFMNKAINNILYEMIDLEKYLNYFNYEAEKLYRLKLPPITRKMVTAQISYYKGNFDSPIPQITSQEFIIYSKRRYYFNSAVVYCAILINSGVLSNNSSLVQQGYNFFRLLPATNKKRIKLINVQFDICKSIESMITRKKSTNFVDTWKPQNKLSSLEKTYFQALNEHLKGNEEKVRELFERLSKENPDLFFVKEAKKYLETDSK